VNQPDYQKINVVGGNGASYCASWTEKVTDPRRLASPVSKSPCHRLNERLNPTVMILPFYAGGVLGGVIVEYLRAGNRCDLLCEAALRALRAAERCVDRGLYLARQGIQMVGKACE